MLSKSKIKLRAATVQTISEIKIDNGPVCGKKEPPNRLTTRLIMYNTKIPVIAPVITALNFCVGTITLNFHKASILITTTKVDNTAVVTMPGYFNSKIADREPRAAPSNTA